MEVEDKSIPDVRLLTVRYFSDHRGYFLETYNKRVVRNLGLTSCFVQDNQSLSIKRGTIRALHFQVPPKAQAKLVRVLRGSIYDVAVDLRAGSPSYGRWMAMTLTAESDGSCSFRAVARMGTAPSNRTPKWPIRSMSTMRPNSNKALCGDPTLAIDWPVAPADAVLSEKDRVLGLFAEFVTPFKYEDR
jgi:dTDP-4-dehydrorhamnose 3,5-epimerase